MANAIAYNDINAQLVNTVFKTKSAFSIKMKYFGMNTQEENKRSLSSEKSMVKVMCGCANSLMIMRLADTTT